MQRSMTIKKFFYFWFLDGSKPTIKSIGLKNQILSRTKADWNSYVTDIKKIFNIFKNHICLDILLSTFLSYYYNNYK